MTNFDVVKKLIGPIQPAGSSHIDREREENLQQHMVLTELLVENIIHNIHFRDRVEYSMKNMGNISFSFISNLEKRLKEALTLETE